jgi:hypothetical protein
MRISFALSLFVFGCSTSTVVAEGSMTEDAGRRPREDRPNRPNAEPAAEDGGSLADDDEPDTDDDQGSGEGGSAGADGDPNEGGGAGEGPVAPPPEPEATCNSTDTLESECTTGEDEDCDGFIDCRDSDCDGVSCGDEGLTCTAGACLAGGVEGLPELPRIESVRVNMIGSTAVIEFEPIDDALDYRVYPMPAPEDVLVGEDGEVVVRDAIYRCAGDRPFTKREDDSSGFFDASLAANVLDYVRTEDELILGYVYTTPGADREPVYRLADPNGAGGFSWDYIAPPGSDYNSADYVVGTEARDALLARGFRDDGIAFYAPIDGTRPVYRLEYQPDHWGEHPTLFFTDGPEYDFRVGGESVADFGERFKIFPERAPGTVPLHRVFYLSTNAHDTLAAGKSRYERALYQGNLPMWSLTWPGLTGPTTLVIEALDQGCPFPGGYISAHEAPGDPATSGHYPSITLDDARIETGEVFINAQHDPANRPKPVARAFVDVSPEAPPEMDYYESFDSDETWMPLESSEVPNWGMWLRRNEHWAIDYGGCTEGNSVGPVLGQLVFGGGDGGSSCNMSITPLDIEPEIAADSFLHLRMTTEIPSTFRRYPQVMITTADIGPADDAIEFETPVRNRLGPLPFEEGYQAGSGDEHTIIVQPFSSSHELQVEFCNRRGWGVSIQCPRANIYGFHAGSYEDEWDEDWLPIPVLGELAGHDRPVQFDVYASTRRVYVTIDEKPAGCAVLPADQMPEGPVTVVFGSVIYHGSIDESVEPENSPHQYLRRYSLVHYDRKIDEIGIDHDAALPGWDETVMPCGTRFYGAEE